MFTIDLLKGEAIPLKGTTGGFVIIAITVVAPIVAAIGMFALYQNNQAAVSGKEKEVAKLQAEIDKLSDAVDLQDALQNEKTVCGKCLSEVKSSVSRHTQWSPILATLIENIPDSVMLTSLEIEHESVRKKVPKKDDPKKKVEVSVPVRILRVGVSGGRQSKPDKAVKEFMDRLWVCDTLRSKLQKIWHSQEHVETDGRQLISYEISCLFKPGL
ncbi:MAG: PilN domain-containing protein [Planctomycetota bacterium]|jgi:hypothetical protein